MAKTKVTGGYIADSAITPDHLHTSLDISSKTLTIGATTVSGHLIPSANITYDLGSSTYRFRDIYLDGTTIDLGGTELKKNSDGDIEFKSGSNFKRLVVSELEFDDGSNRKKFKISSGRIKSFDSSGSDDTADKISLSSNTTDDLSEGSSNLYFTTARARGAISASTGIAISDGAISAAAIPNASLTNSSVTINSNSLSLGGTLTLDTDDIGEGSTNLYFTNARARGAISVSGNALSYDSSTGVLTGNYEESPSFTGNVTISGYVSSAGAYFSDTLRVLNSAGDGWNNWATRSAGNFNLSVGTISSGAITSTGAIEGTSFSDGTISGITFIDEDSFSTNSATRVPTQQSIKAYVDAQVAGVVDSAPAALNTLNELAAALGDDANFSTTTSDALGNRLRVDTASQGLTGTQQANAITNLGITATKAELNYVDGVTSNIQTQLDTKITSSDNITGTSGGLSGTPNITVGTISSSAITSSSTLTAQADSASAGIKIKRTNSSTAGARGYIGFMDSDNKFVASIDSRATGVNNSGDLRFTTSTGEAETGVYNLTPVLTLGTDQSATFAGTISSGAITSSSYGVFGYTNIDPDSFSSYAGGFGNIADTGWAARGLFVHGGGTGDGAAIGHNGGNLYFGIQNGSSANSMSTYMVVTPAKAISMTDAASVALPSTTATSITASGTITASGGNSGNWNTAYGWGNHASAGYITNSSTQSSNIFIRGTSPTIYLRDTDHISSMIHQNSNLFYILRADAADDTGWTTYSTSDGANGRWPLEINLTNSGHYFNIGSTNVNAGGNTVWHAGNDGSGSGLDADTLDGEHAATFTSHGTLSSTADYQYSHSDAMIYTSFTRSSATSDTDQHGRHYYSGTGQHRTNFIPLDKTAAYRMKIRWKTSASRSTYIAVFLLDTSGNNITGSGTYWRYPWSGTNSPTSWTTNEYIYHASEMPSNAAYIAFGISHTNYQTSGATYYVSQLELEKVPDTRYIASGGVSQYYTSSRTLRGYIGATETDDSHFVIATSGGEDIAFKDGGMSGTSNMVIRGNGDVYIPSVAIINQIKLGDGNDGYFYSDTNGRTAFTGGDFYIQGGVSNYYNYATNQYIGDSSGDNIYFRGNTLSGDGWSLTGAGILDLNGGHGALNITNSSILSSATSTWTGDPGGAGKIQYHANRWYIVSDSSSNRIVQFRRNSADVSYIDNSGNFVGNVTGTASNATQAGGLSVHSGRNNEANKVVRTQENGYIMAGWINTTSGDRGTTTMDRIYASNDGYIRYYTPANFGAQISDHITLKSGGTTRIEATASGGTVTGALLMTGNLRRNNHHVGHLEGSYNNVGGNASNTNPIYTIGSSYNPTATSLSNMYGVGYAHPNLWGSGKTSDWGMYVVNSGSIDATIGAGTTTAWFKNNVIIGGSISSGAITASGNVTLATTTSKLIFANDSSYGVGAGGHNYRSVYADTLESGSSSDPLELVYYQGSKVIIGSGGGNKALSAGSIEITTTTVIDSSRNLTNINSASTSAGTNNTQSIAVNKNFGYGFHNDSAGTGAYAIIREPGAWSSPYPDIEIKAHTGLSMGANSGYEGVRIFRDYNDSTRIIQFNGSSNYIFKDVWMHTDAGEGMYSSHNGAHIDPNNSGGSYGAWRILGSRNSYGGFYDGTSGNNIGMYDSGGNGGEYREGNRWITYYAVSNACLGIGGSTTSSSYGLYEQMGGIYSTGNITAYSDRRVKENIVPIDNALEKVNALQGVYYNRIDDEEKKKEIGFIAQDVNEVTPELVTYAEDVDQYGVKYGNTTALLVEAIKELTQKVKELEKKLEEK